LEPGCYLHYPYRRQKARWFHSGFTDPRPSCPSVIHRGLLEAGTPDRCRFSAGCPVVTYAVSWVDNSCHYYARPGGSTHFVRPPGDHLIPSHRAFNPSQFSPSVPPFQPSDPRPRLLTHVPEDVIARDVGAIISSPDERGVLWRSRDSS